MPLFALAAVLALVMGATLGLLGGGGSILTVPILVYILKIDATSAIAMSLFVVGTTSAVAVVSHARSGNVAWGTGLLFGVAGMVGAFGGGRVATMLDGGVLLLLFAAIMLVTGAAMLRPRKAGKAVERPTVVPDLRSPKNIAKIVLDGLVVGAVTGMVGAGGGFLVVPALALLGGLDMKKAIGTSLLVIAMKSFAGFAGFLGAVQIDWSITGVFTAAAIVGSFGGVALARRIPAEKLRTGFAVFVLVMAVVMVYQQMTAEMFGQIRDLLVAFWYVPAVLVAGAVAYAVTRRRSATANG
jgi:uncharacterized membrane protein YfcA